ncbi:MAG: flagellar biosynthetic protein FliQ [Alphaproteobacteria bacterium]
MGFDANVEFLRMAFWQILIISGPLLAVALAIGLAIGILQAATSIQEMTLTFVPKLILVVVAFGLLANFMMVQLSDYFSFCAVATADYHGGFAWCGGGVKCHRAKLAEL